VNNDGPELRGPDRTILRNGAYFRKVDPEARFIVGVNLTVSQRIKVRPGIRSLPTLDLEDCPIENFLDPSVHN
jgi:hypothetical protein